MEIVQQENDKVKIRRRECNAQEQVNNILGIKEENVAKDAVGVRGGRR